jgi:hypothetical protein
MCRAKQERLKVHLTYMNTRISELYVIDGERQPEAEAAAAAAVGAADEQTAYCSYF